MNKKLLKKIKSLPQKPGAYLFKDQAGRLLYIGKAANLRNRVRSHFSKTSNIYKGDLINNIADIDFILAADAKEALLLENELIKKYQPRYNIQWRDDKSYFWVSFSDDEWPQVQIAHRVKTNPPQPSFSKGGSPSLYKREAGKDFFPTPIGPFVNGTELKQVLRALRKILPYRTCKNPYDKPCLQWHLGLCPAHKSVPSDKLSVISGTKNYLDQLNTYHLSLNTLRPLLRLYAGEPIRIEAYDISNIQGASATGSMIVFRGFSKNKSQYRKFRIKSVRGANDVAMLKEVLRRRLNHTEWPHPDLILIDGGRAQLNAALAATTGYSPRWSRGEAGRLPTAAVISLAKKEEELYTIYSNKVLRLSKLPTDFRLLFQAIRDEAHRFAISYYRKLHRKTISKLKTQTSKP